MNIKTLNCGDKMKELSKKEIDKIYKETSEYFSEEEVPINYYVDKYGAVHRKE